MQKPATQTGQPDCAVSTSIQMSQRQARGFARLHCTGGAEVRKGSLYDGANRIWGRLTDVSLGGCFVASTHAFAPQTKITLFLGVLEIQVRARGIICRSHPGLGMGVMFTEIDEQNRRGLEELVKSLAKGGRFSRLA
jgi:hypothetical protein